MKKIKFIYNPFSGEGLVIQYLDRIIKIHQEYGYILIPHRISTSQPLEDAFKDLDDSYHHILISGGDGTINQVINILKNKNLDIPIAVLPLGTANDFAKHLKISPIVEKACRQILEGKVHSIDLGKANDKYFINVFSFGLFTDISQKTTTPLKNTIGKLAYYFNGIKEIPNFKKMDISVFSDTFSYAGTAVIFFAFNGQTAGNINIAYKSKIDDGMLDIIIIKGEKIQSTLLSVFEFLKGAHLEHPKDIIHIKSKEFEVHFYDKNINTDIDGEPGPGSPVKISCIKNGLKIIY